MNIDDALKMVRDELLWAIEYYPEFNSFHEGFAILLEEVDELWEEVRQKPSGVDRLRIQTEATQVAAMAVRMIIDLTTTRGLIEAGDSDEG